MLISTRANTILLVAILAVGIALVAMLASGARGGPLDPTGAPSATGTLPQVEPRSPIPPVGWNGTFPITVSQPGSYFLTRNHNALNSAVYGIVVTSDNVNIDLNGFTLDGGGNQSLGAIDASATPVRNLRVTNGVVRGWGAVAIDSHGPGGHFSRLQLTENGTGLILGVGATLDASNVDFNTVGVSCACGTLGPGAMVTTTSFAENTTAIVAGAQFVIESNQIDVPTSGTGVYIAGQFVTIRDNIITSLALTGYVPIAFGAWSFPAVVGNRVRAGISTGNVAITYDVTNVLTNFSP